MRKLIVALSVAASFAVAPAAHAADDVFLRIDGIQGDAAVQNMPGYINVGSYSWGAENKLTIGSATGGAGAGKAQFEQLTIEKLVDSTSPALFQRMATGTPIKSVELVIRKSGGPSNAAPYLRYHFQTAFVTSTKVAGGTGEDASKETVSFAFGAASQEFKGQSPSGAPLTPAFAGWNVMKNMNIAAYPGFGTVAP